MTRAIGKNVVHLSETSSATTSGNSRWLAWAPDKVDELLADLKTQKVALLRADWTRRAPAITAALAILGRNGVPVYVMHQPGKLPMVLSEILSVADVRGAMVGL